MSISFGDSFMLLLLIWVLAVAIVNIAFALGVFMDADLMFRRTNKKTFLVSNWTWAFATLVGGVFFAGVYWAIHHSTLNPNISNRVNSEDNFN